MAIRGSTNKDQQVKTVIRQTSDLRSIEKLEDHLPKTIPETSASHGRFTNPWSEMMHGQECKRPQNRTEGGPIALSVKELLKVRNGLRVLLLIR